MNRVTMLGRVVRQPEVRYTQNQKVVAQFDIAVNRIAQENPVNPCRIPIYGIEYRGYIHQKHGKYII